MKKMLFLLLAATFALCNCTKQDLDEIRAKQAELDTRLSALEEVAKGNKRTNCESAKSFLRP